MDTEELKHRADDLLGNRCYYVEVQPKLQGALREVIMRLPEEALDTLVDDRNVFIIFPEQHANSVHLLRWAHPPSKKWSADEQWLVVLAGYLRDLPYSAVVGTIAHELAHVYLRQQGLPSGEQEAGELQADDLAKQWGFYEEVEASIVQKQPT
jgi:hypothetical protein